MTTVFKTAEFEKILYIVIAKNVLWKTERASKRNEIVTKRYNNKNKQEVMDMIHLIWAFKASLMGATS